MTEYATTNTPEYDYPPLPDFPELIKWRGKSGTEYEYAVHYLETGGKFYPEPAIYVFAREVEPNKFEAIYVGETANMAELFDDDKMMRCINRHKATHVCVSIGSGDEGARRAEKQDLIEYWRPPCNG